MTKKNILSIISFPFLPATTGGEIATLNILKYLSFKHNVTAYTVQPYKENYTDNTGNLELIFGMSFKTSRYYDLSLVSKMLKLIRKKQAEWLFFHQPWFGWLMILLKLFSRKKIFIRSNNIEYMRFRSMGKWFWQMLYIYEKWTYRAANLVVFITESDRQKAIYEFDLKPEKTHLSPYGVEAVSRPEKTHAAKDQIRKTYGIGANEKLILFFSTLSYLPNYEAVTFITDQIYPLLKQKENFTFKILICGKGLPDAVKEKLTGKPEIIYAGFVDDISLYIDAADVMINPLLSGGGVKTKAIDTLARSQRVVSTQNGAEGIDPGVCGDSLVIVEDHNWPAFADAIVTYIDQPALVPQAFYDTYGWTGIIDTLTRKLNTIK